MDVHTRRLRHFVAVAEALHFTRAAETLYVSQQGLSRSITELEHDVGVPLLNRTTRAVELTDAGKAFLRSAREALVVLDAGVADAHRAHSKMSGVLRIGFFAASALELTPLIISEFRSRHPSVSPRIESYDLTDPSCGLRSGETDVAFLRLPIELTNLNTEVLFTEPLAIGMTSSHPLAAQESVRLSDLQDQVISAPRTDDARWRAFWTLRDLGIDDDRLPRISRDTATMDEELDNVAAGVTLSVSVPSTDRFAHRASLVYRVLGEVPGSTLCVGWRGQPTPLVQAFIAVSRKVRDERRDLVTRIESGSAG
ncbi:LysR family transcriptional regulator [Rhodococcus sp. BGS-1C]|jgi:DNA-binding transcriptional LysR family regulator|uniref:LysR substrate-binding domain-containing protein n=1 Tax=unclassified Rhodococcus (in: high G+C Gram-positive bacteria) TaxID=192944 RepID=UPI00095FA319|nr:LysR substrate-binding domain-containing protein [Rhodococcus sp. KRD197]OLT33270.1 LysR family transcriptional regulator [Rhodococcus sp. CUA-806]